MADANTVSIAFQAEVGSLQQGAAQAAHAVSEVGDHSEALEHRIHSLKNEMMQGDRTLQFYMRSMSGLVPTTGAAAEAIRLVADGLIGGMGLTLAIQGAMFAVSMLGEGLKLLSERAEESERAEATLQNGISKATDAIDQQIEALRRHGQVAGQWHREQWQLTQMQVADTQDKITETLERYGTTQKEIDEERKLASGLQNDNIIAAGREIDTLRERKEKLEHLAEEYAKAAKASVENADADEAKNLAAKKAEQAKMQAEQRRRAAAQEYWATLHRESAFEIQQAQTLADLDQSIAKAKEAATQADAKTLELSAAKANEELPVNLPGAKDPWEKQAADAKKAADAADKAWAQSMENIAGNIATTFEALATGQKKVGDVIKETTKAALRAVLQAALKSIMASAYSTGAKAAESQASVPIVGPALAAGAMAAGIGMVMALVDRLPSAAGGMLRVPGDMLAQIHKDESIIPANEARTLRALLAGGGSFGGQQIHIHAIDAQSFADALNRHDSPLAHAIGGALRRGVSLSPLPEGIG